ncbi:actin-related protein 6-like [Mercenaria mercenaria]|uniref:actin-related protein 6-like n=1 Tax=Mercenaria mercenaria TaxID=6596 RepID=UPI00234FA245|nr:actin-related protein 6-like [Mercenaria mercenaria]
MVVLVLDNGAGCAKVGYSTDTEPKIIPNCVSKAKNVRTRIFIGDQIDECKDLSGLYYLLPFQKGYMVNWEVEKQVWDYTFGKEKMKVDFNETSIILTEPYFNFTSIQEGMNEVLFEEYGFNSAMRTNPSFLSQYKLGCDNPDKKLCALILDTGYSFSHIVPYCMGEKLKDSIVRINIGGKVLTNHLKEIISYRQLMVMDETYVINQLKEDVCYVSTQFNTDMKTSRKKGAENTVMRDYVLPDYTHIKRGYVRPQEETTGRAQGNEQIIRMNNERFAVPELLFHPSDVGVQEMGIAEALIHSVGSTEPEEMHPHLYSNILTTGGNCLIPGFQERFHMDVRSQAPDEYGISITSPSNPITYAWEGGVQLANDPEFIKMTVTREEYEEYGHSICHERFDS